MCYEPQKKTPLRVATNRDVIPSVVVRGIGDMEKSISPVAFCGTLPLYTHKIVELAEAFEEDADLLLDRFL